MRNKNQNTCPEENKKNTNNSSRNVNEWNARNESKA